MLTAMRLTEQILASNADKGDGPFHCPECQEVVRLRKGLIKVAHFAHIPPVNCVYGSGETELHRSAKMEIYNSLLTNPSVTHSAVERSLRGVRPDVSFCIDGNKLVAIEVQASKLRPEEIIRRTQIYSDLNVSVLWVPPYKRTLQHLDLYRPGQWERCLHAMYFGRVYYWLSGEMVQPVRFVRRKEYVPISTWYDASGQEQSGGGYDKIYKGDRIAELHEPIKITSMSQTRTSPFRSKTLNLPASFLWIGTKLPAGPEFLSKPSEFF